MAEPPVVTLAAPYGAGGSVVGPRLAERLGVPFIDRAVPAQVATRLNLTIHEALERDDAAPHGLARIFAAFARVPGTAVGPVEGWPAEQLSDDQFVAETERVIRQLVDRGGGAVVLGRAGAIVLADRPGALHVRLTGPREARVAQAARLAGLRREVAESRQRETDAARRAYVRTFYGRDPDDPSLYHVMLDATRVPLDQCVEAVACLVERSPG